MYPPIVKLKCTVTHYPAFMLWKHSQYTWPDAILYTTINITNIFPFIFYRYLFNGKCWLLSKWNRHAVERTIDYLILTIPNLSENDKCADNIAARAANSDTATSSYRKLFYQPNRAKQVWTACMLIKQQPAKTERYAQSPQALGGRYGSEPQPGCGSR